MDGRPECSVEGCRRPREYRAKGYCRGHYSRWLRTGDAGPAEIRPLERKQCSLDGCERPHRARGYCIGHYERVRKYGTPGPVELRARRATPPLAPRAAGALSAAEIQEALRSWAEQRRLADEARAQAMASAADWVRAGVEHGVPIAHLAEWVGVSRQTIYDILAR